MNICNDKVMGCMCNDRLVNRRNLFRSGANLCEARAGQDIWQPHAGAAKVEPHKDLQRRRMQEQDEKKAKILVLGDSILRNLKLKHEVICGLSSVSSNFSLCLLAASFAHFPRPVFGAGKYKG